VVFVDPQPQVPKNSIPGINYSITITPILREVVLGERAESVLLVSGTVALRGEVAEQLLPALYLVVVIAV
jgi:hypothetical protein